MSRPLRIEFCGAWYHTMNRGANRVKIFHNNEDYSLFLDVVKEAGSLFHVTVSAYCLMSNHYHLLVNTPEGNISRFMRHVNGVYTQRHNRKYGKDGPLFRGRFKSVLVQDDVHLMSVVRYLHLNPIKAKLVKDIKDFLWSSHDVYLRRKNHNDWVNADSILQLFSNNRKEAVRAYKDYLFQGVDKEVEGFYSKKYQGPIFGDIDFIQEIKDVYIHPDGKSNVEIKEKRTIHGEGVLALVNKEVCRKFMVDENKLCQIKRGEENIPRIFAITLTRELSGLRMREIAERYRIPSYRTVGTICYRFKERVKSDKKLLRQYKTLKRRCSQGRT